jgi:hypothetical protein
MVSDERVQRKYPVMWEQQKMYAFDMGALLVLAFTLLHNWQGEFL